MIVPYILMKMLSQNKQAFLSFWTKALDKINFKIAILLRFSKCYKNFKENILFWFSRTRRVPVAAKRLKTESPTGVSVGEFEGFPQQAVSGFAEKASHLHCLPVF